MKPTKLMIAGMVALAVAGCSHSRHSGKSHTVYETAPTYSQPAPVAVEAPPQAVPETPPGKAFATPEAAMKAVAEACGTHDAAKAEEIFGPGATGVLWSGDEVADKEGAMRVKSMIEASLSFEEKGTDRVVAAVGAEKWPFPIPLVKAGGSWRFDLEGGKEELLNRRIGRNELSTIETMYAYVAAQREYFAKGRDGNPPAYAQKVRSTEGKQDGLYWKTAEGAEPSPLGPLVVEARGAGYGPADGDPEPFHGYYYKILKGQGSRASGGKKSYVDGKGLMTGGFAAIAWPATYDNSGVMTFVVNQTGIVFQKDLGEKTASVVAGITEYDPDATWHPSPYKPIDE
jgi:hypothetical protein